MKNPNITKEVFYQDICLQVDFHYEGEPSMDQDYDTTAIVITAVRLYGKSIDMLPVIRKIDSAICKKDKSYYKLEWILENEVYEICSYGDYISEVAEPTGL